MAKKRRSSSKADINSGLKSIMHFMMWLTGIVVSLAVAFGMIAGNLQVPWVPTGVTEFFGWVVVVTTIFGVVLAIARMFE